MAARKIARIDDDGVVQLGHGAGGVMSAALIDFLVSGIEKKNFRGGVGVDELDDGATIPGLKEGDILVVTSDGHTVDPLFFPGGDLGKLSVCGTVNDVLMMGASPVAMTHVLLIEEGFPLKDLARLNKSFIQQASDAGVAIIAGDTKVMPHGTLKGCVSATTGIGVATQGRIITDGGVKPGDEIVVTGTLGDHGAALIACREGISFESDIVSDVQLLTRVAEVSWMHVPHAMKDPTRGGLATALNEFSTKSGVSIWIDEERVPFRQETVAACEMLGLSPYELPSEGRAVIAVPEGRGEALVSELRQLPESREAMVIGVAREEKPGKVFIRTRVGGTRILTPPIGELIPRVC